MRFNERIRSLREEFDFTQSELAKRFNMTQRKISRLETGDSQPSLHDIFLYCHFFAVSADYILGFTDKRKVFPKKSSSD